MPLQSNESRVTRRAPDGTLYQWSNAQEKPEGSGWTQASKAAFPRVRTYLWFRNANNIEIDRRNATNAAEIASKTSEVQKLGMMMFRPFHYIKQKYEEMTAKKGLVSYAPHTRVLFGNQPYYTVGGVNDADQTIRIKNPVTGEIKQVNAKEITAQAAESRPYAVGDKVVLSKGTIDPTKEHEVMILGYNASKGMYSVSLSALDPKQKDIKDAMNVYPEAIDALIPGKRPNNPSIKITDDMLSDMDERKILETLHRANKSGRNSVQIKEIISDLKAHGMNVGEHQVVYTLSVLNRIDPNIQYNVNSGGVYLGAAKPTLDNLLRLRNISPEEGKFGLVNLSQDSQTDTYAHSGIRVKSDQFEGIIDSIVGDIATIITGGKEKKYVTAKLDELKDQFNRTLHIDPAAPKHVGNVRNKDIFWVLRDREGVKSIKEGDTVALLPGVSNLKANKNQPLSGKVLSVNNDGTVDMLATVGNTSTRLRAFHRQLATTPKLKSMQELRDYLFMHKRTIPGATLMVNNTEVVFGDRNHRSVTLNFANGEDYANNEHHWFAPIASQANPSGWESVISSLGNFWAKPGDLSTTLAPTKAFLGYINEVYPNAKFITIARDTTTTPELINGVQSKITFKVTIDKEAQGKRYNLDRLYEQHSKPNLAAPIPATALGENNSIRMETDGESLFIRLGKLFKEYRAEHLPAIELHESELSKLSARKREEYEATKQAHSTIGEVINANMFNRRRAWDAQPDGRKLVDQSGVFTYDQDNDRYVVALEHYHEAHNFLKSFFGDGVYQSHVFETEDKGHYSYAANKLLGSYAIKHIKALNERQAAREDKTPLVIKGFYQGSKNVVLRPYQNAAVRFMLKNNATLLAMDQGTGKSISAIAALTEKLNRMNAATPGKKHRALIIAPAAVAQTSWMNDLGKSLVQKDQYGNALPGTHNYTLLMGKDRIEGYKRLADNNDNTSIGVTSFNTFALQDWLELRNLGFDVVVMDEAQAVSGSDNAGIITVNLQTMLADIQHKMALTGTPLENEPEDLQAILAWLKPETFGDKRQFMNAFVDEDYREAFDTAGRKTKRRFGVRLKNLKALRSKLDQMMFRVEKDDLVEYNEPAQGEKGVHVIKFDAANTKEFDKYVAKYKSPETDEVTKARIGELSVVPMRSKYPLYDVAQDGKTTKINFKSPYNPLTTEGYPEYDAQIAKAKSLMKMEYMKEIAQGRRPGTQQYLIHMQQVMNDPSLLAKKYPNQGFEAPVRNPKVDRMINIISNHFSGHKFKPDEGGKIIIFAEHVETIKFLEKRLTEQYPQLKGRLLKYLGQGHTEVTNAAGIKTRADIESAFNKDPDFQYPIMLANNAAKTGVNLPAANVVINYDIGWNPQDINQRIDRAHRIRSLKDIVASNTAPARNVTAHTLAVTDSTGDINYSVEARKLFSHKVKEKIFETFIKKPGKTDQSDNVEIPGDDYNQMTEELLNVTDKQVKLPRAARVDPEQSRGFAQARSDARKRKELEQQYGPYAKYFRDYPRGKPK